MDRKDEVWLRRNRDVLPAMVRRMEEQIAAQDAKLLAMERTLTMALGKLQQLEGVATLQRAATMGRGPSVS